MPFGMGMTPPPYQEEEDPLAFAQGMGVMPPSNPAFAPDFEGGNLPSTNNPDWIQQLLGASSTPPESSKPLEGGAALMQNPSQGSGSKWLDTLAPILAGAAAVFGHRQSYGDKSALGPILSGVGQGYADYLTTTAKEKRDLKVRGDNATVDLAHKYLSALPGDVDEAKYPGLAEMGRNVREKLVNGQLSSPKEAQDFILEYTKYKEDIAKLEQDKKLTQKRAEEMIPYEAFQQGLEGVGVPEDASISALLAKYGKLTEDPERPGSYIPIEELGNRARLKASGNRDVATSTRAAADRNQRAEDARLGRESRSADVAKREAGAEARSKRRLGLAPNPTKGYDSAFSKATNYALAKGRNALPSEAAKKQEEWKHDYLIGVGKDLKPLTRNIQGKTYYYVGEGKWDDKPADSVAPLKMAPPPPMEEEDDFGEDPFGGE